MKLLKNSFAFLKSPLMLRIGVSLGVFIAAAFLAYIRYTTYIDAPNFYAEDGSVFAKNIMEKGFFEALLTPFNGYFISGLYLLEGFGFFINDLFFNESLLSLPAAFGIASYLFWGFLAVLPLLLFWNNFKNKLWPILLSVSLAFLPLPTYNYAIIGTIGNYKFAFLFIAFLLVIKRLQMKKPGTSVYFIDAALILCAFTNASVYLLLPFALLSYWPGRSKILTTPFWKNLLRNKGFLSLLILYAFAALQVLYIISKGGIEDMPGYLQEPYQWIKTVEIFLHRSILFPIDHLFIKDLSNVIVIIGTAILGFFLYKLVKREDRNVLFLGLFVILGSVLLFVTQRPGVSHHFNGYTSSGPDQFFYAQNMIFLFVVFYIFGKFLDERTRRFDIPCAFIFILLSCITLGAIVGNDINRSELMNRSTGSLGYAIQEQCRLHPEAAKVDVPLYPVGAQSLALSVKPYCEQVKSYTPDRQPLPLIAAGNNYIPVNSAKVTQTFRANYNNLEGVSVFLSTFGNAGTSVYTLKLYDQTCKYQLRQTLIIGTGVIDNFYHDIVFRPIASSKNKTYCFTIEPQRLEPGIPAFALQLSSPDVYLDGLATKGDQRLNEDLVFDILYKESNL